MKVLLALLTAVLIVAGCGDDAEKEATAPPNTELTVSVYPKGPEHPPQTRTVTDAKGLTAKDFEPVPGNVACTEIFGGPETATVTGTLDGARIDAEFSRNNGCEIARWDAAAPLLGQP